MFIGNRYQGKITYYLYNSNYFIKECLYLSSTKYTIRKDKPNRGSTSVIKRQLLLPRRRLLLLSLRNVLKVVTDLTRQIEKSRKLKALSSKKLTKAHITQEDTLDSKTPLEDNNVNKVAYLTIEAKGKYPSLEQLLNSYTLSYITN